MNRSLSLGPRVGKALPRTFDSGVVALSCDATRRAAMRCDRSKMEKLAEAGQRVPPIRCSRLEKAAL
jgi:hypothetical protein